MASDRSRLHHSLRLSAHNTLVLTLEGPARFESGAVLEELADPLDRHDGPVQVDLQGVAYMDATGLRFLAARRQCCAAGHRAFTLTGVQPQPARLLAGSELAPLLATSGTGQGLGAAAGSSLGGADPWAQRYAVTLPDLRGGHTPPTVVVVHRTSARAAGGGPVYADDSGRYRFAIAGETAQPLPGTDSQGHACLHATRLA